MVDEETRNRWAALEIDITHIVNSQAELRLMSGSVAELGSDAAEFTWNNSRRYAKESPLIDGDNYRREAAIEFFANMGFSESDEMRNWPDQDIDALLTQYAAGSLREYEIYTNSEGEYDWSEIEKAQEDGSVCGRVYQGIDDKFYLYIGN